MSKHNDFANIGQVYGDMLNGVKHKLVEEGKADTSLKGKETIGEVPLKDGGPTERGGFKSAVIDKKNLKGKKKKGKKGENLYNIDKLSYDQETDKETKKIAKESINNFMRKKSYFDKLYENVMGSENQPGLGGPPQGPMDDGMSDSDELDALGIEGEDDDLEGGDEVTFTLDRETAQKLCDVLSAAIGGGEDDLGDEGFEDEGEDDFGGDDEFDDEGMDEDEEGFYDEDEEELGTPVSSPKEVNYGKNNKVGNLKPQSGGASSAYTDKVGNDGDHGHAISSGKEPNYGKNNKVGKLKTGKSMFEQ